MPVTLTHIRRFPPFALLRLQAPAVARHARPGQFVMLRAQDGRSFWRRPFSICRAGEGQVELLIKAVGPASTWLTQRQAGDQLELTGPLGRGFRLPGRGPVWLVGGGFGVAPLRFLAETLRRRGRVVEVFLGGRCRDDLLLRRELRLTGAAVACATEDGSVGTRGRVTALLDAHWHRRPRGLCVAAAGPMAMLAAVARSAAAHAVPAEVSLEAVMACGLGVCNGCVIRAEGRYQRVCQDGPVFDAAAVEWNA